MVVWKQKYVFPEKWEIIMQDKKLYLVDDDESVLDALCFMLEGEGYQPRSFSSAEEFLSFFTQHSESLEVCSCLVLDCRMPGMSGQELQIRLNQSNSLMSVIFLTGHGDIPIAVDSLKRGAVDFLQKPIDSEMLLRAIASGLEMSARRIILNKLINAYEQLTRRERDVLHLLIEGKTNYQIAESLFIAVRTVEVHRASIMQHMRVSSLAEMIRHYTQIEPFLDPTKQAPARIRRKRKITLR